MKFYLNLLLSLLFLPYLLMAQDYDDHYGTGKYVGVSVTSSDEGAGNERNLALKQPALQSSNYSNNNYFASYANDGNLATMNHTKNPNNVNIGEVRNLALNRPVTQYGRYGSFPANQATDGNIGTMNHTSTPNSWTGYNVNTIQNLALNKPVSQSSTSNGRLMEANDGDLSTINHTNYNLNAWWEVDLEEVSNIQRIELFNRTNCCQGRLDTFHIFISDVPFTSYNPDTLLAQPTVTSYSIGEVLNLHTIDVYGTGRYVRVQLADRNHLHMRELRVWGLPKQMAWLEVDLGMMADITDIEIENRSNCCSSRLNNSYVFVSDVPFTSQNVDSILVQPGVDSYFIGTANQYTNYLSVNRTGRYVRIQLTDETVPLHVNEIRVLGRPRTPSWWEVDLGTASNITDIEVFNRTSCCKGRLNNSYVLVSDTPFGYDDLDNCLNKTDVSSYFIEVAQDTNVIAANRTGRYVRIQSAQNTPLHMKEVRVLGTQQGNAGINTLNGARALPDLASASRFLGQATMGCNYEEIEALSAMGIDAWLEEQFNLPHSSYLETYNEIRREASSAATGILGTGRQFLSYAFYQNLVDAPDVLRQKIAFALSQILVVSSDDAVLAGRAHATSSYYDILYQNSFGNFRDILSQVSMHPVMGIYLSSFRNSKADFGLKIFPDENYAREIMQLFSIGLWELNNDGTNKLDANGEPIPTYDNEDIEILAKVFTGMAAGARTNGNTPTFELTSLNNIDLTVPMGMYDDYHDKEEKILIDGTVLPAGQSGIEDIEATMDMLFNHPNVGPFLARRLIQQLVKSNPTPAYINRVANAFNNNGMGVRGDLKAVVEAILTDPEARTCDFDSDEKSGKLKQPVERFTNLFLAFDVYSPSGKIWYKDEIYAEEIEQEFLGAPTVFNFFTPFYAEKNYVEPNDMVSPEFQILSDISSFYYINLIEDAVKNIPFNNYTAINGSNALVNNNTDKPALDFSDEIYIMDTEGIAALLDRLDILLCHGQLSDSTRATIADVITQYQANVADYDSANAVKDAIYFIMISPDYIILK